MALASSAADKPTVINLNVILFQFEVIIFPATFNLLMGSRKIIRTFILPNMLLF